MRSKLLVSFVLLAVMVTACAPETAAEPVQVVPASAAAADLNLPVDFDLKLYQGQESYGGDVMKISNVFAEGKPVVMGFYAGMCPTCIVELPRLQAACDEYEGEVNFVLVDVGPHVGLGTEEDGANMLDAVKASIPAGTLLSVDALREYGVLGTPSAFFFHADGTLDQQHAGLMTDEQIEAAITALLP